MSGFLRFTVYSCYVSKLGIRAQGLIVTR